VPLAARRLDTSEGSVHLDATQLAPRQLYRAPLQKFLRGRPRCGSPYKSRL